MKQSMITLLRRNGQPYNQTLQWTWPAPAVLGSYESVVGAGPANERPSVLRRQILNLLSISRSLVRLLVRGTDGLAAIDCQLDPPSPSKGS